MSAAHGSLSAPVQTDRDGHSASGEGHNGQNEHSGHNGHNGHNGPEGSEGSDKPGVSAVTGIAGIAGIPDAPSDGPPAPGLWQHPALRWVAIGGLVSMLGDQFTLLAMPWLLLSLTTDPLALGAVMAVMGLPQAVLMLVGGAVVDRVSPRTVLLVSRMLGAVLLSALALLVALHQIQLWMVMVFAALTGIVTAFGHPARSALLPTVVPRESLQAANGLLMGLQQATMLIGPALAGLLIVSGSSVASVGSASVGSASASAALGPVMAGAAGLGGAFALDALSFLVAALMLLPVRSGRRETPVQDGLWHAIGEGLRTVWRDRPLRALCGYIAAMGFLIGGPLQVGLPLLVREQIGGAGSLGALLSVHSAGVLLGMVLAGTLPRWRLGSLGSTVLAVDACAALLIMGLARVHELAWGMLLLLPAGTLAGFLQVAMLSWIQQRVPTAMLGRMMSLLMVLVLGLTPLSSALAGLLMRWTSPASLFIAAGGVMLLIVAVGAVMSPIRHIRDC